MSTDLALMPIAKSSGVLEVVQHLREIWDLADILVRSRMIPNSVNTPEAAAAIILKGHELGIGPMQAFDSISVIQGKPTISPQLMVALVERSRLLEDKTVEETPDSCTIMLKRKGRSPVTTGFTRQEAVAMGLAGKDNWKKQFGVMMYWRCEAKANRRVFPDVIAGCYTPEEMGAEVGEDGEILDQPSRVRKVEVHLDPDDGNLSHIDGEIVEPPQKSAPGLFTRAHVEQTKMFNDWVTKRCNATNDAWRADWEARLERALDDGHGVPSKIEDVINPWQSKAHLLKWAIESGRLADVKAEATRTRQTDAYVAAVFYRSDDDKAALKAEMGEYVREQRRVKSDAIYRKNPDLAPDGWDAEQAEAAETEQSDPPAETPATKSPRFGRELFNWIKDQELVHDVGLLKYVNSWAKLQDFPGRMVDWDGEMVALAYEEACRKLSSVAKVQAYVDSIPESANHGDAYEGPDEAAEEALAN